MPSQIYYKELYSQFFLKVEGYDIFDKNISDEYRDLVAAVRSKDSILFKPFIVVLDEDFINEQKTLKSFYENMYTPEDFEEFFRLNPNQMVEDLNNMPIGIRETIKSMAVGKIQDGVFDSVARIKALDDYFGTKMMLLTELYGDD